jgi:hypothetical protein
MRPHKAQTLENSPWDAREGPLAGFKTPYEGGGNPAKRESSGAPSPCVLLASLFTTENLSCIAHAPAGAFFMAVVQDFFSASAGFGVTFLRLL